MFYVYELIDPRDGSVFYVGKGKGNRVAQHARRARAGCIDNVEKYRRITEIHAAGLKVGERIASRHDAERMAYAAERVAIEAMREGLTNIVGGTKTNAEANAERAKLALSRMKSFEEWVWTATPAQAQACGGSIPAMRAFYDDSVAFLSRMAAM